MLQILLTLGGYMLLVFPLGWYLYKVAEQKPTFCDAVFNPIDNGMYALCRIDKSDMNWKQYAVALLLTNAVMLFMGYFVLRMQGSLPLNPSGIDNMEVSLSFNTIVSFMTNTNLQHYSGESGLSYLSQMLVIIYMMFTSAATGYVACLALSRGMTGQKSMGNYYVDMIRVTNRALLPLAIIVTLLLVWQGSPQNMNPTTTLTTLEGHQQDIAMGPIASLVSIKHLGTNGGGYLGANSSTPLENPTIISNIIELYSMMLFPGACVIIFGLMYYNRKRERALTEGNTQEATDSKFLFMGKEARTLFIGMGLLYLLGISVCYYAELDGNPALEKIGISQSMGSMEGKEVRLGIPHSALFAVTTTSFTTGTVNNMHDTLTPLGGMVPLLCMMVNAVFGGIGVGFMNVMMYMLLTVFVCGLMIGRTPEYLGKKIESKEMKLATLCIIAPPLLILGFSALAVATAAGLEGISNPGFHGLSQVLYEYSSAIANNGSGFEGLNDDTFFWNMTAGLAMFYGRYIPIVLQLAVADSLMLKKPMNVSVGTLRTDTLAFPVILASMILVLAALTFFPAVGLGPIAEHLTMWK